MKQTELDERGMVFEAGIQIWEGRSGWFPIVLGVTQNKGYNGDYDWHTELLTSEHEEVWDDYDMNPKKYERTYPSHLSKIEMEKYLRKDFSEVYEILRESEIRYLSDQQGYDDVYWRRYGFR